MSAAEKAQAFFDSLAALPIFWPLVAVAGAFAVGALLFGGRRRRP